MASIYSKKQGGGTFTCLEFRLGRIVASNFSNLEQLLSRIQHFKENSDTLNSGLCILFEDISPDIAASLDSLLEIGPAFFYDHLVTTTFDRLDTQPTTAGGAVSPLPSDVYSEKLVHFRFQRILELDDSLSFVPYKLCLEGNSQRKVRRMPQIPGRCVGIAESCFSIAKIDLGGGTWICLMLMDSTSAPITSDLPGYKIRIQQKPYRESYYGSDTPPPYSPFPKACKARLFPIAPSFLEKVANGLLKSQKDSSSKTNFSIIELAQHPIRIIVAEWALYSLLMGRYMKLYELSFEKLKELTSSEISNILVDLYRWRRRSQRSLEKLQALRFFIKQQPNRSKTIELFTDDVDFISNQIVKYRGGLEAMVPIITSMIQLMDSRRAIKETMYLKRLTYIALFFLPLSYVASLFSMNEGSAINKSVFKIYLATAIPLLVLVLLISTMSFCKFRLWWSIVRKSVSLGCIRL